jgi:hypothetical protein
VRNVPHLPGDPEHLVSVLGPGNGGTRTRRLRAARRCRPPAARPQPFGDLLQQHAAVVVAERVVDLLERSRSISATAIGSPDLADVATAWSSRSWNRDRIGRSVRAPSRAWISLSVACCRSARDARRRAEKHRVRHREPAGEDKVEPLVVGADGPSDRSYGRVVRTAPWTGRPGRARAAGGGRPRARRRAAAGLDRGRRRRRSRRRPTRPAAPHRRVRTGRRWCRIVE